ncbi:MAG: hypothetical protein LBD90_01980, partial [Bifidobacteriaceae bacterium]|nr:hypothetical protein [Bifidobacteriaceae bacterium]
MSGRGSPRRPGWPRALLARPPTPFQEAVAVRRVAAIDGYAMIGWLAPAFAAMVAGEVALG